MGEPAILTHTDGCLLTLTVNRPEKANALSLEMVQSLTDTLIAAGEDTGIHAIILTGAGDRVFCAGADLSEVSTDPEDPSVALWDGLAAALSRLPILTVAALTGPCIGGGMTLALGCDIRIGVPETRFSYPALRNNVQPGAEDTARLQQLIGPSRTACLLMGGQSVDARTALSWGLLDQCVSREALEETCLTMTKTARAAPRDAVMAMKVLSSGARL